MSTMFLIVPPSLPNNPMVLAPLSFEVFNPSKILLDAPLVEIPITTSPASTSASHCLLKIPSKS